MRHNLLSHLPLLPVLLTSLATAGCGAPVDSAHALTLEAAQSHALRRGPVVNLDDLYNDPATRLNMAAAAMPGSPCGALLKDVLSLGAVLAPAVAAQNYLAIAQHLPELLATFTDLFACVESHQAGKSGATATPQPPEVPAYDPAESPCVTVVLNGKAAPTCE
ncbi:MAG: hypothetical protein EOO40_08870 [Deltaproteobacteria bacterium]|nr:MAG: hypothetical protein EOO40_08870 [Deltaproteobacteria bacterium]